MEVARLSDRASAIANLTLFTAEPMQVTPQTCLILLLVLHVGLVVLKYTVVQ